jgi:hypothetical protein
VKRQQQELLRARNDLLEPVRTTKAYIGRVAQQALVALDSKPHSQPYADYVLAHARDRALRRFTLPDNPTVNHGFVLTRVTATVDSRRRANLPLREMPLRRPQTVAVELYNQDPKLYFASVNHAFEVTTDGCALFDHQANYTFPRGVRRGDTELNPESASYYSSPENLRADYSTKMLGALAATQIVIGTLNRAYELDIDTSQPPALVDGWRDVHPSGEGQVYSMRSGFPFHPTLLLADSPEFQ